MSCGTVYERAVAPRCISAAAGGLAGGHAHLLVLSGCLPLAFPVYHDPPTMDRYYAESGRPIPPKIAAYAEWIRSRTPPDAVFAAGEAAAPWIPPLTRPPAPLAATRPLPPSAYAGRRAG